MIIIHQSLNWSCLTDLIADSGTQVDRVGRTSPASESGRVHDVWRKWFHVPLEIVKTLITQYYFM